MSTLSSFSRPVIWGTGSWGTALATLTSRATSQTITLVGRDQKIAQEINEQHGNQQFLPEIDLATNIKATTSLDPIYDADLVLFVVPTSAMRSCVESLKEKPLKPGAVLISCAKGIERASGKRMSEIIAETFPDHPVAVLSGPNHAEEIARNLPAAATIASECLETRKRLQEFLSTDRFRLYTSPDVAGVELGGALKNIFAIAAGVAHGLNLGDNAVAALTTRSLREMIRVGTLLGGEAETFTGLSGLGDLMTTCFSPHSRNFRVGQALARGSSLEEAVEELGMVAEGVPNTRSIYEVTDAKGLHCPIIDVVYDMLYRGTPPLQGLERLYQLEPKPELA